MSGEMTRATPMRLDAGGAEEPSTTAGAWKHSDLPPPVGSTTTLSLAWRIACIASRCSGRNSEKPQTRCSASRSSASCVMVFDVVIDEALKLRRELVVGAAQRGDVFAVDEDGTGGRLAGARQADADVRRFRLAGAVHDAAHHGQRHRFHAGVPRLPLGHHVADVALNAL